MCDLIKTDKKTKTQPITTLPHSDNLKPCCAVSKCEADRAVTEVTAILAQFCSTKQEKYRTPVCVCETRHVRERIRFQERTKDN